MKNVLFEFLDSEPIENVVTSLNFAFDKCIFFGYEETIPKHRKYLKKFLAKYCDNEELEFVEVHKDLQEMLQVMRESIQKEKELGARTYFDVTGGETLPLIAIGILSRELNIPMHLYDIKAGRICELEEGASYEITEDVPRRKVKITIPLLIELRGGVINEEKQKNVKDISTPERKEIIDRIYELYSENISDWTAIISTLRNESKRTKVKNEWQIQNFARRELYNIRRLLPKFKEIGLLSEARTLSGDSYFKFSDQFTEDCIREEGAILELHTCLVASEKYDDCRVGVHVDWDGEIKGDYEDVLNEIDVMGINGYAPVLISCKAGRIITKEVLYELETVAEKFGGKYSEKVLVVGVEPSAVIRNRAREMGIRIEVAQ